MTQYPDHIEIAKTLLEKQAEINRLRAEQKQMQDLLGSISLYVNWRFTTKQLTTPQKEMWANARDAWSQALQAADGKEPHPVAERWWRDDFIDPPGRR